MQTAISPASLTGFVNEEKYTTTKATTSSRYQRFSTWCTNQEEHRILWLALTFLGLIGVAVPCTLISILTMANNNFTLWMIVCAVNVPVMAISLAAQPTKITIPALLAAYAIDFTIVLYCAAWYLMH